MAASGMGSAGSQSQPCQSSYSGSAQRFPLRGHQQQRAGRAQEQGCGAAASPRWGHAGRALRPAAAVWDGVFLPERARLLLEPWQTHGTGDAPREAVSHPSHAAQPQPARSSLLPRAKRLVPFNAPQFLHQQNPPSGHLPLPSMSRGLRCHPSAGSLVSWPVLTSSLPPEPVRCTLWANTCCPSSTCLLSSSCSLLESLKFGEIWPRLGTFCTSPKSRGAKGEAAGGQSWWRGWRGVTGAAAHPASERLFQRRKGCPAQHFSSRWAPAVLVPRNSCFDIEQGGSQDGHRTRCGV